MNVSYLGATVLCIPNGVRDAPTVESGSTIEPASIRFERGTVREEQKQLLMRRRFRVPRSYNCGDRPSDNVCDSRFHIRPCKRCARRIPNR